MSMPLTATNPVSAHRPSIAVNPLSPALGAEILGVDLREELSPQTVAAIIDAWHEHLVIVFRDQKLTEDQQIRFAKHFGELKKRSRPASARNESGVQHGDLTMLVSNIRENGKLIGSLADGEMHFHSDYCYMEKPAKGTFLYAIEIPSQGGDTLFLDMYKAYDALPAVIKSRIEGRKAVNAYHYESLTRSVNEGRIDLSGVPHFTQPMVCTHSETGRKALYVNRLMTWSVEGMDDAEGSALLSALFEHIEQDQFIYTHKWRVGDLVLWDNRCTLHARTDFSDKERRLLRRHVVEGDRIR